MGYEQPDVKADDVLAPIIYALTPPAPAPRARHRTVRPTDSEWSALLSTSPLLAWARPSAGAAVRRRRALWPQRRGSPWLDSARAPAQARPWHGPSGAAAAPPEPAPAAHPAGQDAESGSVRTRKAGGRQRLGLAHSGRLIIDHQDVDLVVHTHSFPPRLV